MSSSSGPPPRGSSPSQRRKDNNERRLPKASKEIDISHEGGFLNASLQEDVAKTFQELQDGGVLKDDATNDVIFTP